MDNHITLPIWETISAGWQKVYGAKASIWVAIVMSILIMLGFNILHIVAYFIPSPSAAFLGVIVFIVQVVVQIPLSYGFYYLGIKRAADQPISYDMVFYPLSSWSMIWKSITLFLLMLIIGYLPQLVMNTLMFGAGHFLTTGTLTFINSTTLPPYFANGLLSGTPSSFSIGLAILISLISFLWFIVCLRLCLAVGFLLEGASPWGALKLSWRATKGHILSLIGVIIVTCIIIAISVIPLGLGLIWTIPWFFVLCGVIYNRLKASVNAFPQVKPVIIPPLN